MEDEMWYRWFYWQAKVAPKADRITWSGFTWGVAVVGKICDD